jgi:hypothetical protein
MMKTGRRTWWVWVAVVSVVLSLALLGGCSLLGVDDGDEPPDPPLLGEPMSWVAPVPKTGQTQSYDFSHVDDGGLRRGVAWPSPRFTDEGDGTVTDRLTGLVWLKDGSCLGAAFWETSLQIMSDFNRGKECNCTEYVAGSYTDWRLPNVRELFSLIDFSQWSSYPDPMLPAEHPFLGVQSTEYWTSTSTGLLGPGFHVSFVGGYVDVDAKMHSHRVWAVRGGG